MSNTNSALAGERTQMTYEQALDKVRKLMRLSESANQNEAALAAAKAQEIIDRFKIEKFSLEYDEDKSRADEPIKDFGFDPIDNSSTQRVTWKIRLAGSIARENQCKAYSTRGRVCLVGRASDVNTVRYLYAWMVREVEQLSKRDCAGCGRTYHNNYKIGCVETIANRLHAQRSETIKAVKHEAVNPMALMRIDQSLQVIEKRSKEVTDWVKSHMSLRSVSSNSSYNHSAREAGRRAGREVNLRPSSGRLTPSHGGLLSA